MKKKIVVNVSGGKDSTATLILALKRHKKEDIIPLFADTGWEHPLTYEYLNYLEKELDIKIVRVKSDKYKDLLDLIKQRRTIPSGKRRICTDELKLLPQFKYVKSLLDKGYEVEQWVGIRKGESNQREKNYGHINPDEVYEIYTLNPRAPKYLKDVKVRYPVINLSTKEVFDIIHDAGLEVNPLYLKGHDKVGCFPCILGSQRDFQLVWKDEIGRENILKLVKVEEDLIKQGYNVKLKPNKTCKELAEELKSAENQCCIFDDEDGSMCGFCHY